MEESSPRTSLIDEIAGQLFAAFPPCHQPADWPGAPSTLRRVRRANQLVDAEAGQWRKAAPKGQQC